MDEAFDFLCMTCGVAGLILSIFLFYPNAVCFKTTTRVYKKRGICIY